MRKKSEPPRAGLKKIGLLILITMVTVVVDYTSIKKKIHSHLKILQQP